VEETEDEDKEEGRKKKILMWKILEGSAVGCFCQRRA